ncbi:hypothetical protein B0I35DRAFT_475541 [Stachybotrys elegans]|uniref:DUF7580 domain-containing protein n=1 Tax=Stachybotrys elegans TaxID=80388 RepID=A0A8K0T185_9HYPO|nr:hypothetical protein B0I35DRAFT_475541 [Stachybotrys elegans]
MSGLEIVGVVLGAFPLIIAGLEQWRDVAKVGGFFWQIRKEYTKCRRDVQFYELMYKRNLKELLLPAISDADHVSRLVNSPGGQDWADEQLQLQLKARLQESFDLYMDNIQRINETVEELRKELSFDKSAVQEKVATTPEVKKRRASVPESAPRSSRLSTAKSRINYEAFRVKFSFNESVRNELFDQLKECNTRLEQLLKTSDKMAALQHTEEPVPAKRTHSLEVIFKKAWKHSALLFSALQKAWQCPCRKHHVAHLRLEHRTMSDMRFELLLSSAPNAAKTAPEWLWKEIEYANLPGCAGSKGIWSAPSKSGQSDPVGSFEQSLEQSLVLTEAGRERQSSVSSIPSITITQEIVKKKVTFASSENADLNLEIDVMIDPSINLCRLLSENEDHCFGIVGYEDQTYHLHPFSQINPANTYKPISLDFILSEEFVGYMSRRQRYSIALLLASSVAQLRFTPWIKTNLTKHDVLFFPRETDDMGDIHYEPFIRQSFDTAKTRVRSSEAESCNFYSLGIILLELCFGRRLEDHPMRKKHPAGTGEEKMAFDLMVALKWSCSVRDEGGDDYAAAVKWCFTGANEDAGSWRGDVIDNVIRPLERCQEHFKAAATVV